MTAVRTQSPGSTASATTRRVTVCGSFGFGNAGDEAVPLAIADLAADRGWPLALDVITRYSRPDDPDVIGLGPHDASRRAALRGQPLLFAGGGITEPRDNSTLLRCRHLIGEVVPESVHLFAASAEAYTHSPYPWLVRWRTRGILNRCGVVSARDVLSAETYRMLAPRRDIPVTGDVVLWMRPDPAPPESLASLGRYLAVTLAPRWSDDPAWAGWISQALARIAAEHDLAIAFVPCSARHDDDRAEHNRIAGLIREIDPARPIVCVDQHLDPRAVAAAMKHATLAVGMRLHACIMAYAQRTPCVGLAYHTKLLGFARTVGWEPYFPLGRDPGHHTSGSRGYPFHQTGLLDCDLPAVARDALQNAHFERLEPLRSTLADTLAACLEPRR